MQRKPNLARALAELARTNRVWLVDEHGERRPVSLDSYLTNRDLPPNVRVRATEIQAAALAARIQQRN